MKASRKKRRTDLTKQLKKDDGYTYADYLTWNNGLRYEIINGIVYMMSPAPSRNHQKINGELYRQISNFLKGKKREVYHAPFDVRLSSRDEEKTVFQPDITVICDPSKLDKRGCIGAPDMAVEVLSPSNSNHDTVLKLDKYLKAGVREYWVADPEEKMIVKHILNGGAYISTPYSGNVNVPVTVLEGLEIDLAEVFDGIEKEDESNVPERL